MGERRGERGDGNPTSLDDEKKEGKAKMVIIEIAVNRSGEKMKQSAYVVDSKVEGENRNRNPSPKRVETKKAKNEQTKRN